MLIIETLDLEGDFTITSGTFIARAGNHNVEVIGIVVEEHFSQHLRGLLL